MSDTVTDLVELPLRVVKQPTPELNPGGDCGACVLAGLLGMSVEDVYATLHRQGKPYTFGWGDMEEALRRAYYDTKAIDRYVTRTPMWPAHDALRAWGDASWSQQLEWRSWLRMAFDAGYYAFATVRHTPEPGAFETNHWVLYAGLRTSWRDGSIAGSRSGSYELLVSDSSRTKPHEEWFEMGEHLKGRGGFAVMLARPTQR